MHNRRCYVSVCALNGQIYAMGGHDGNIRLRTVERYCVETNQWTIMASMHARRSDSDACVLNGKIYMIGNTKFLSKLNQTVQMTLLINTSGGFDGSHCLRTAEMYDPDIDKWEYVGPMLMRRSGLKCVSHKGSIYAIGGFNGSNRLSSGEKYNSQTNSWSLIRGNYKCERFVKTKFLKNVIFKKFFTTASIKYYFLSPLDMNTPRSNYGIEVIDDMIFLAGGFNGVTTIDQAECYIEHRNQWYL